MIESDRLVSRRQFAAADNLVVGFALVAAICYADHIVIPASLERLLAVRLTVANLIRAAVVFSAWSLLMRVFRTYTAYAVGTITVAFRIAGAVIITSILLAFSFDSSHRGAPAAEIAADFALFCLLLMYAARFIISFLELYTGPALLGKRKVVIVGSGPRALRAFRYIRTQLNRSHEVAGFLDCRETSLSPGEIEHRFLGSLSNLEDILIKEVVDEVVIALPPRTCYAAIAESIDICKRVGTKIRYPADLFPTDRDSRQEKRTRNPSMIVLHPTAHDGRLIVKRVIDLVTCGLALLILSPIMLVTAALIKLTSKGPVFFVQERYGIGRRRFRMLKFRSMVEDAEAQQKHLEALNEAEGPIFKIRNDPRITKVGAYLRRTSIDELPQLMNVFLGHMSLVGPRPMSIRDVSLFSDAWLMRRFSVKPGITGLWQINGRSKTSFERWIDLDLQYIDNWSLGLDARIIALTIPTVVKGTGAM